MSVDRQKERWGRGWSRKRGLGGAAETEARGEMSIVSRDFGILVSRDSGQSPGAEKGSFFP